VGIYTFRVQEYPKLNTLFFANDVVAKPSITLRIEGFVNLTQ